MDTQTEEAGEKKVTAEEVEAAFKRIQSTGELLVRLCTLLVEKNAEAWIEEAGVKWWWDIKCETMEMIAKAKEKEEDEVRKRAIKRLTKRERRALGL